MMGEGNKPNRVDLIPFTIQPNGAGYARGFAGRIPCAKNVFATAFIVPPIMWITSSLYVSGLI